MPSRTETFLKLKTSSTGTGSDCFEACLTNLMGVFDDLIVQFGCKREKDRHMEGGFAVPVDRIDNGDRLTPVRSDRKLFLVNTSFSHEK